MHDDDQPGAIDQPDQSNQPGAEPPEPEGDSVTGVQPKTAEEIPPNPGDAEGGGAIPPSAIDQHVTPGASEGDAQHARPQPEGSDVLQTGSEPGEQTEGG